MTRMLQAAAVAALVLSAASAAAAEGGAPEPDDNWLKRQFHVEQKAWVFNSEYLAPTLYNRRIDVVTLEAARAWRFRSGLEIQLRGGLTHTDGARTDSPPDGEGPESTTTGVTAGVDLRYYVLELGKAHLFADASAQFYWAPGQPFPSGGSAIDGFFRGGAGLAYDISPTNSIEVAYHYAHMSNGGKPPQNPVWEGEGGSVGFRHSF